MSAPTRQFANLSLGEGMPTTRGQAQRLASASASRRDDSPASSSSGETSDGEVVRGQTSAATIGMAGYHLQSPTGMTYDVRSLSPASRQLAEAGMQGDLQVDRCWSANNGHVFHLHGNIFVRIGDGTLTCSCTEVDHSSGRACGHIYWLLDRLYRSVLPHSLSRVVLLAPDGTAPHFNHIYDLLGADLAVTAHSNHWPVVISPNGLGMAKQDVVRDILSTFTDNELPESYLEDEYRLITRPRTLAECLVPRQLGATVFRLAMNDDGVYRALREAQPAPSCASQYYNKLRYRINGLMKMFHEYCTSGIYSRATGARPEIKYVALRLQECVDRISRNLWVRGQDGVGEAADCLILALQVVCVRDEDAFEGARWRSRRNELEEDRNLYHRVIRCSSEEQTFVLDILRVLPRWALQQRLSELESIRQLLDRRVTPPFYEQKIRAIIAAAGGSSTYSQTGTSGPVTRGAGVPTGQKRRAGAGATRGGQKRSK